MKYKAVLFDMDGTVLNTLDDLTDSINYSLFHFGYAPRSREYVAASLGNGAKALVSRCMPDGSTEQEAAAVLDFYRPWYDAHALIRTAPYDGITALTDSLSRAGIKTAIISNKPHSAVIPLAGRFFPGVYSVGERPGIPRKPAPDSVLAVMKELGVTAEETVYIGDTEVDIRTAAAAGTDCIAVSWGFRSADELRANGAKIIADTPEELGKLLMK